MELRETVTKTVRDAWSGLLDLVYPPHCAVCGSDGDYLCAKCIEQIDIIGVQHCRKCGIPSETYHCSDCREKQFSFEFACSAGIFEGALREAIHALKYRSLLVLAEPLADLMARCFPDTHIAGRVDLIVPIPIHKSRTLERGFNQATELSKRLSSRLGLRIEPSALVKPKETRHQVDLPIDERAINLRGAFRVKDPDKVVGKRVLLIDDVFTTGSTLDEAAKTLREAGASSVYAYTLARSM